MLIDATASASDGGGLTVTVMLAGDGVMVAGQGAPAVTSAVKLMVCTPGVRGAGDVQMTFMLPSWVVLPPAHVVAGEAAAVGVM